MKPFYMVVPFLFLSTILLILSCNPKQPAPPQAATPIQAGKPRVQGEWEKTMELAKAEGKVVVLSTLGAEGHRIINKAFKEKFGLEADFMAGSSSEFLTKLQRERGAGLYIPDVYLTGASAMLLLKERGFLDPLKPLLILPEAIDTKLWTNGQLRFHDNEGLFILGYQVRAIATVIINSDVVKPDEIKSYKDLLSPKWKGKIVVYDPSIGSVGIAFFQVLWVIMGPDFTREFGKQDLVITRDGRQQVEWLARGKYPVSGTLFSAIQTEFVKLGAPIKVVLPVEGTMSSASQGAVSFINNAPHPNASKIFINWLLTKEGQTIMSQITGDASRRLDVSTEGIDPAVLVKPGVKYIDSDTEEMLKKRQELQSQSREFWNIK